MQHSQRGALETVPQVQSLLVELHKQFLGGRWVGEHICLKQFQIAGVLIEIVVDVGQTSLQVGRQTVVVAHILGVVGEQLLHQLRSALHVVAVAGGMCDGEVCACCVFNY